MKYRFQTLFVLIFALSATSAVCQDVTTKKSDGAQATEQTESDTPAQAPEASPFDSIRELVKEKDLDAAIIEIEKAVEAEPKNSLLQNYRGSLAAALYRERRYENAFEQVEKRLTYMIENPDQRSPIHIAGTVVMMRPYATRAKKLDRSEELIEQAFAEVESARDDDLDVYVKAMATMVPAKSAHLTAQSRPAEAREFVMQQLKELSNLKVDDEATKMVALGRLHIANINIPEASDADQNALDEFLAGMQQTHAESDELMSEYVRLALSSIRGSYLSAPKLAEARVERLQSVFDETKAEINRKSSYERELKSYRTRIASALKLAKMVGTTAPQMDIESWVNQGSTTADSLKGKVVMLDFWSVWCGPCIATFPHLREWREEFGDQGFEIVGVTRYYNYTWDDAEKRAKRSKEEVSSEAEREMLEQFLAHHKLAHPTIVTPKGSSMQSEFGVTGIPHVVLIDRSGKIQLVKVGAGPASAAEIHKKLTELVAQ